MSRPRIIPDTKLITRARRSPAIDIGHAELHREIAT
jgi:hypothetical protein